MAHYSSLFTLGLLSDRASPPPSPESNIFYKFRKSSLPTRTLSKSSSEISGPFQSHHAPPQFTNPFANSSHSTTELRSFLSLDLAADTTLATRHSSKHLSPLDTGAHPHHPADLPPHRKPSSSWHFSTTTPPLSLPSARRPSRDSLRTLPSPRPAPSSALPEIPSGPPKDLPHLPPIMIPHPSLFPAPSPGGISPTSYHAPLSAPPAATLSPSDRSSSFALTSAPVSPLSSPSFHGSRQGSFMSFSSTGTSIRTSRRRNMERSNALACLEGRSRNPARVPRSMRQRNFMSMSDDEAEEVGDGEDTGGDADVEEMVII
ncbi:hypothetical protein BC826DRAFT_466138 [Russula brevipes]|nr:hypothetical protein BC826DRAFT_466138 [Russula brevipes]